MFVSWLKSLIPVSIRLDSWLQATEMDSSSFVCKRDLLKRYKVVHIIHREAGDLGAGSTPPSDHERKQVGILLLNIR